MNDDAAKDAVIDPTPDIAPNPDVLSEEPYEIVEKADTTYTILGTAHVSQTSADEVARLLETNNYDAVAIELDDARFNSINNPNQFADIDLFKIIKDGKAGAFAAQLALGSFQQRLAEQFGVDAGAEMKTAIRVAKEKELPILKIDRDIGTTLKRVYANVPWWQRMGIFGGLVASVLSREEIKEEDIEKLKEGDMLESTFQEFAEESQNIFLPLISERDEYMALRLKQESSKRSSAPFENILVVIGAGHLKGLTEYLKKDDGMSVTEGLTRLEHVPTSRQWWKIIPWLITAIIIVGFVIGFQRGPELGWTIIRDWVLFNGVLAALGALIATAHPLTIIGSFFAAPLTSLNPLVGAGYAGAGMELWLRKPKVSDFEALRSDVTDWRGWWRNRVSRTLLVFIFVTLGSAAGTYLAGFRIFGRLMGS